MNESDKINKLYQDLVRSKKNDFPPKGTAVKVSNKQGVYIIYSEENKVLHVGTTKRGKNGLNQRLNNHRNGKY